ncbi:hypothetical protein [Clostridium magnum]|uniref:Uncharacterized protein n=1 Tax=Clostridium magnum DSM 2767 TaxID=1121326 RepID=A0A162QFJ9_9CLOT|nr:hypothetical protein [Clostridium magnum]KZL88483.1 hypothetical protein CLMAG_62550 [Clostridium magnum DSM 2767]SHI89704.1 hypothetical protein SAMN02745944_05021 [Clostridium magnum DSM 2767]
MSTELFIQSTNSKGTTFGIDYVTGDKIGISYDTLPNNMPNTYGNYIALWQNTDTIPWNQEPLKKQIIDTNTQNGSIAFSGLEITNQSYIIGYAVGPEKPSPQQKYGNICSTAFIPATGSQYEYFYANLTLTSHKPTSVAVDFQIPVGSMPMTNKAWLGMWRSSQAAYNNPPDYATPVDVDAETGTVAFNDIKLLRRMTYTIALFMDGWQGAGKQNGQTTMAATLTFTNE